MSPPTPEKNGNRLFQKLAEIRGRGVQLICRGKHAAVQHRLITSWEASHSAIGSQKLGLFAALRPIRNRLTCNSLSGEAGYRGELRDATQVASILFTHSLPGKMQVPHLSDLGLENREGLSLLCGLEGCLRSLPGQHKKMNTYWHFPTKCQNPRREMTKEQFFFFFPFPTESEKEKTRYFMSLLKSLLCKNK